MYIHGGPYKRACTLFIIIIIIIIIIALQYRDRSEITK